MATEQLIIRVTASGTRRVARDLKGAGKSAEQAGKGVSSLNSALRSLAVLVSAGVIIKLGDDFQNLQNRLRIVTDSTKELNDVTSRLFEIARETRTSISINAEAFSRFALSLKEVGVAQEEVLQLTKSVNQAIIISGATGQEARAGLIQFAQGLASGTLRGDELRSVLEQLPFIADVIGKRLGVTRGALRLLAEQGKITADVILKAFQDSREEIEERFAKTIPTVAQSFEILRNSFTQFLGDVEQATGVFAAFGAVLRFVADNIKLVATAAILGSFLPALALADKGLKVLRASGAVALVPFTAGLKLATAGLAALRIAIAANPITALLVASVSAALAIASLVNSLTRTEEKLDDTASAQDRLNKKVQEGIKLTKEELKGLLEVANQRTIVFGAQGAQIKATDAARKAQVLLTKAERIGVDLLNKQGIAAELLITKLDNQAVALLRVGQARRVAQQLNRIELQLARQGIDLASEEFESLRTSIQIRLEAIDTLKQQSRILESIIGPQETFNAAQEVLKIALTDSVISLTKYNELLRQYELAALKASLSSAEFANSQEAANLKLREGTDAIREFDVAAQSTAGLGKFLENISDISGQVSSGLTQAFDGATDALADFAVSGFRNTEDLKKAFSSLFADIAKGIIKIIIQTLILKAIQAGLGGGVAPTGGGQAGGAVGTPIPSQAGGSRLRQPLLVGEQGPEVFVPPSRGRIVPAGEVAAGGTPAVNVNIINATDPEQVTTALSMPEGKRAILNVIGENPGAVRSLLGAV